MSSSSIKDNYLHLHMLNVTFKGEVSPHPKQDKSPNDRQATCGLGQSVALALIKGNVWGDTGSEMQMTASFLPLGLNRNDEGQAGAS